VDAALHSRVGRNHVSGSKLSIGNTDWRE
jgi:hypothetical protein